MWRTNRQTSRRAIRIRPLCQFRALLKTHDNYLLQAKQPSLSSRRVRFTPEILNMERCRRSASSIVRNSSSSSSNVYWLANGGPATQCIQPSTCCKRSSILASKSKDLSPYCAALQCESKKSPLRGPDIFHFFHKPLRIFNRFFTRLLYVPIYARLQIFI